MTEIIYDENERIDIKITKKKAGIWGKKKDWATHKISRKRGERKRWSVLNNLKFWIFLLLLFGEERESSVIVVMIQI